ncbi:FABP family protein [Naumannella sp. ID2617S]|uniref:FABP family protein n=1 Tax=Enemella dayhoffiae TaxID=2016507 RepID=A0A255H566_9ACTN|nr:FABP family protein [Enemella dayhoffiae]NNG20747.1 FABP family protein [Naumannella sp. ID2617S]OYO22825.1 FABP family protein [Enemella dayhoffiae]
MTDNANLDFTFPEGLHPRLKGLAWLIGHWEGFGQTQWPGSDNARVLEQVDFHHNGEPYLHYLLQAYADEDGQLGRPLYMETGFWVPGEKNEVMAVITNPEGVAQKWHGSITGLQSTPGGELGTKIELTTDAVLSQGTHTAGSRLYGKVADKLMFACDRADQDIPLRSWLTGELERR